MQEPLKLKQQLHEAAILHIEQQTSQEIQAFDDLVLHNKAKLASHDFHWGAEESRQRKRETVYRFHTQIRKM